MAGRGGFVYSERAIPSTVTDMKSVATQRRRPSWLRVWTFLLTFAVIVVSALLFWQLGAEGTLPAVTGLWVVLGVLGFLALLTWLVSVFRYRSLAGGLAAPLIIALLGVAVWYNVPERAGWRVSVNTLEGRARSCEAPGVERTRLGVYTFRFVGPKDGGCLFYLDAESQESRGFAWFPDGEPRRTGSDAEPRAEYSAWRDGWYRFTETG